MPGQVVSQLVDFDIDRYINPWIPHSRLSYLPAPVSRWLGYRKEEPREPPVVFRWISTFVGSFLGLLLVGAVYRYAPGIRVHNPSVIIASLGATAVLDYNAVRSPLAQPRSAFLGHSLSAISAVAISKLFQLNSNFENLQWIAGATTCAVASLIMSMTNSVHPPGGATAVLAATQANTIAMGWWFVPVVMVGVCIMFGVALLVNNVQRQYPVFWWTPEEVGRKLRHPEKESEKDVEHDSGRAASDASSERTLGPEAEGRQSTFLLGANDIAITRHQIQLPAHIKLTKDETTLLENLQKHLQAQAQG